MAFEGQCSIHQKYLFKIDNRVVKKCTGLQLTTRTPGK
uniref:Uncharacterized protein n=1 Tax=Arundo donax TaxID=35708 RepID=A0A0A8Y711_ARUDO